MFRRNTTLRKPLSALPENTTNKSLGAEPQKREQPLSASSQGILIARNRAIKAKNALQTQLFWFMKFFSTHALRVPTFDINTKEPTILSYANQATRFAERESFSDDARPIETGDHVVTHYNHFALHNMMMWAMCVIYINEMNAAASVKINNGRGLTENEDQYLKRACDHTIKNWAHALTNDINCFAIQEGVVKKAHLHLFQQSIEKYLPDWKLTGGTEFGLWFLVRKTYAEKYNIDPSLSLKLKTFGLHSRCLTLCGPDEKVSNIHVPHENPEENYKKIIWVILKDMLNQINPTRSSKLNFDISHIVSDQEHMKDDRTRFVSVSGITELTLRCDDKIISHKILGDFNLELSDRQQIDRDAFLAIQKAFVYDWSFRTIRKNFKYIAGLAIGGGITFSTDIVAIDEAGAAASLFRMAGVFSS